MTRPPLVMAIVMAVLAGWSGPVSAQGKSKPARSAPVESDLSKLQADLIGSMTAYRESLDKLLAIYERDIRSLSEQVEVRRMLYSSGLISKSDLEEYEQALAKARSDHNETKAWMVEADHVIIEAMVRQELLKVPPLPAGGYTETPSLVVFNGGAKWSLADAGKIQKFFQDLFGRALPVSAFGQTAAHDRMRLDHRDAMDVAVHPDSSEGRAIVEFLRKAGIPFLAFRGKLEGSATGAHIHIGRPSLRTTKAN